MRGSLRHASPIVLAALALAAAAGLPALAHAMTDLQRGGDYALALRAHVAWARAAGFGLALASALMLARVRMADPAKGARQGIAILLVASTVGIAAALPAYDAWVSDRVKERYLSSAPGWESEDVTWPMSPEFRAFTYQGEAKAHTGDLVVPLPTLEKGDHYQAYVSFEAGGMEGYYRSDLSMGRYDRCDGWEGQTPQGHPSDPMPTSMQTFFMRTCTASRSEPTQLVARWGTSEPVDARVAVILRPAYANGVEARLDESLALVGGALAIVTFLSLAVSTPKGEATSRAELAALALGPALACAAWATAALAPRSFDPTPDAARAAAGGLAVLAVLAALVMAGLVLAAWRGSLRGGDALRWSSYLAAGLATFTPVPATHLWRYGVPLVVLGMLGTLMLAGLALLAASRLATATGAADERWVAPT